MNKLALKAGDSSLTRNKIWLSSPHMGGQEIEFVLDAFEENWIAPVGPNIQRFERALVDYTSCGHAAVLSSGTAALHLALIMLGVGSGDFVICQSLTFAASANPIRYQGAVPVFVDSEEDTWNLCPQAVEEAVKSCIHGKVPGWEHLGPKLPKAIVAVDLFGMPAKMVEIKAVADKYGIPIIEDAAEALGSKYGDRKCGTLGDLGIYSFNGNKIITTSSGGALVSTNKDMIDRAVFLATQAREAAPHFEHVELGFNYRLSNVSAGIGCGQMNVLPQRVSQRRFNFLRYRKSLGKIEGIHFLEEPDGMFSNRWLTTIVVDAAKLNGLTREDVRLGLLEDNIESRPIWKPLHLQPLYRGMPYFGGNVAADIFNAGLCLPSGSNLEEEDLDRVIEKIRSIVHR